MVRGLRWRRHHVRRQITIFLKRIRSQSQKSLGATPLGRGAWVPRRSGVALGFGFIIEPDSEDVSPSTRRALRARASLRSFFASAADIVDAIPQVMYKVEMSTSNGILTGHSKHCVFAVLCIKKPYKSCTRTSAHLKVGTKGIQNTV